MHYQIFIPQAGHKTTQALLEVGLGDFIAGAESLPSNGPEDMQGGLLFGWRKPGANQRLHYNSGEQTWIPALPNGPDGQGRGRYWVGFWNDSPVTPADLQRPYSHPGKTLELGDGNSWRFPAIHELPRDLVLADDGSWKFSLQREYHDLWLASMSWIEKLVQFTTQDFAELADFCVRCLQQNYRILPEVVSHLRLLNTRNISLAIGAILDLEVV